MKVYCKDCRYRIVRPIFNICSISEELMIPVPETADHPEYTKRVKGNPLTTEKNKNNDCKDFKKKYSLILMEKIKSWVK